MTTQEAWDIYEIELEQKKESHKRRIIKSIKIWAIVSFIFLLICAIMVIIGYNLPLKIDSFTREKERSLIADLLILEGWVMLGLIPVIDILCLIRSLINIKKGPDNFLAENKRLYLNCLRSKDIDEDDIEYYKQKLENIRHIELLDEIRCAGATASSAAATAASASMMYHMIDKK